jgi:predicted nucleic acid-binding protein
MYISALLTDKGNHNYELAQAIEDEKIDQLITSRLILADINHMTAVRAAELHLKYGLPTADSLVAATGLVENTKHILTDDSHFAATKNLIKPIDLKKALKLISQ